MASVVAGTCIAAGFQKWSGRLAACAAMAAGCLAPQVAAAQIEAGTYKIDTVHSSIMYKVVHMELTNSYGRFNDFSGTVTVAEDPTKSTVEITVKTASIDSGNQKRDQHLNAPDFFNTKQFPEATFKSTGVKKIDDKNYEVTGDLTIMGTTKSVTSKFTIIGAAKDPRSGKMKAGGESTISFKRSDFKIGKPMGLGDDVTLTVAIEAEKQ